MEHKRRVRFQTEDRDPQKASKSQVKTSQNAEKLTLEHVPVGTQCEVYSHSQRTWMDGSVVQHLKNNHVRGIPFFFI